MGHHSGRVRVRGSDRLEADDAKVPETSEPRGVLWVLLGVWTWMFEQIEPVPVALLGTMGTLNAHLPKMHTLKVGSACSEAMEPVPESRNPAALQGVRGVQWPFPQLLGRGGSCFIIDPWVYRYPALLPGCGGASESLSPSEKAGERVCS